MLESYCLVGLTEQIATTDIISSRDLITLISTYEGSQMCSETPRCTYFECNKRDICCAAFRISFLIFE